MDIVKLKELLGDDAANENERFGLFWPGKKRALRAAQLPTTATLKPDFARSKDWDTTQNVFIEGDNLEVLKLLQKHYHNKIKLIYIDPPYNTGKDFVYPDNYVEGLQTYLEWTKQVNEEGKKISSNSESEGRYHSNWLNMMYPRLKLARNLLTDDGVILVSIGDKEVSNLIQLMAQVFGENNQLGIFTWKSRAKPTNAGDAKYRTQRVSDYVVAYGRKSADETLLNVTSTKVRAYPQEDRDGKFRTTTILTSNRGMFRRETMRFESGGFTPDEDTRWKAGKEIIDLLFRSNHITFNEDEIPVEKKYEHEEKDALYPIYSFVEPDLSGTSENGKSELNELIGNQHGFDTVKPIQLLRYLISTFSNPNELVLDFFAGTSTTAHALMELNAEDNGKRRFIMVQLPEPTPEDSEARKAGFQTIADISRKRIELAGEKIKADSPITTQDLDTGFRAYQLADTNFAKWRVSSDITPDKLQEELFKMRDSAADEASADDLLTEILLKMGFPLTAKITPVEIAGLPARWIGTEKGEHLVLAYLDEHTKPTLEQLRELVAAEPERLIVLEDAFDGDDELKTNLAQLCRSRNIELWTA